MDTRLGCLAGGPSWSSRGGGLYADTPPAPRTPHAAGTRTWRTGPEPGPSRLGILDKTPIRAGPGPGPALPAPRPLAAHNIWAKNDSARLGASLSGGPSARPPSCRVESGRSGRAGPGVSRGGRGPGGGGAAEWPRPRPCLPPGDAPCGSEWMRCGAVSEALWVGDASE